MSGRFAGLVAALAWLLLIPVHALAQDAGGFKDWAAVVVAADFHAHSGATAEVFDNARRDLSADLVKAGFAPEHISQFSGRPELYPDSHPLPLDVIQLGAEMRRQADAAPAGCFVYFTSHGNTSGIVFGNEILPPGILGALVDRSCGQRPSVVFVSACFSGVFVSSLAAPNRMVMTAARPDRSSFGCQEEARYTFFDDCVIQTMGTASDFLALGDQVKACVSRKETEMRAAYDGEVAGACGKLAADRVDRDAAVLACQKMNAAADILPPSEPQLVVGSQVAPILSQLKLR